MHSALECETDLVHRTNTIVSTTRNENEDLMRNIAALEEKKARMLE